MLHLLICPSIYSPSFLISYLNSTSPLSFNKCDVMASRSRSSRSRHSSSSSSGAGSARISEDQVVDLLSKLQHLIPEARSRRSANRVSASKVLQETCNYIKSLNQEVDDLSERLADLLASMDVDNAQAAIIRSLLM